MSSVSETTASARGGVAAGCLALLGAIGFLTRVPVGNSEAAWSALVRMPAVIVVVAYPLGMLLSAPVVLGIPAASAALLFPVVLLAVAGITHLDGVADLGDAVVVHGGPEKRISVMRDTTVGVGAVAGVVLVFAGMALAALALAGAPWAVALAIVVAAEATARASMVVLAALGGATHEGMGSALTERLGAGTAVVAVALVAPAALWPAAAPLAGLSVPHASPIAAVCGGFVAAGGVFWWARRNLGGVNGDVFGAANELARVAALHAGVVVWSL